MAEATKIDETDTDTIRSRMNVSYCLTSRVLKASVSIMCVLGKDLIALKEKLGDDYPEFVKKQLPFDVADAELLMQFADRTNATVEEMSPANTVTLTRLLSVIAEFG